MNGSRIAEADPVRIIPRPNEIPVELLPQLEVPISIAGSKVKGVVSIQFALLPVEAWSDLPNSTKRLYRLTSWSGVSVLRSGREIAQGWHFLEDKRKENYDCWWRCELNFSPHLDEAFGVTHTKQGIHPTRELKSALTPIISGEARALNRIVRLRFKAMQEPVRIAERRARERDNLLAEPSAARVKRLNEPASVRARGCQYRLEFEQSENRALMRTTVTKEGIVVYVNTLHPFYRQLYAPILARGDKSISHALASFVLALGRVAGDATMKSDKGFLDLLSDQCAVFLRPR
jgi:hypothetical protein